MVVEGHLNYFKIDDCGLYKMGSENVLGCDAKETFCAIAEWINGRPLSNTIPWDPSLQGLNKPACYCKDIYIDEPSGDILLVLWKSDSAGSGGLLGAEEGGVNGQGAVIERSKNAEGKIVIWGRPCYYWIIPEYNAVVSIKFNHSVCDSNMFQDYVYQCITQRVNHNNRKRVTTPEGYPRIVISAPGDLEVKCIYRFNVSLRKMVTSFSEFSVLAHKTTHIIRRKTIIVDAADDRKEWIKALSDYVPFVSKGPRSEKREIEVRIDASPTVQEIREIVEKYASEHRSPRSWDNVGFVMGDNSVRWADQYRLSEKISINTGAGLVFSAVELYDRIHANRPRLIRPLKDASEADIKMAEVLRKASEGHD